MAGLGVRRWPVAERRFRSPWEGLHNPQSILSVNQAEAKVVRGPGDMMCSPAQWRRGGACPRSAMATLFPHAQGCGATRPKCKTYEHYSIKSAQFYLSRGSADSRRTLAQKDVLVLNLAQSIPIRQCLSGSTNFSAFPVAHFQALHHHPFVQNPHRRRKQAKVNMVPARALQSSRLRRTRRRRRQL